MQVSYTCFSEIATPFFTKKSQKEKCSCYNIVVTVQSINERTESHYKFMQNMEGFCYEREKLFISIVVIVADD